MEDDQHPTRGPVIPCHASDPHTQMQGQHVDQRKCHDQPPPPSPRAERRRERRSALSRALALLTQSRVRAFDAATDPAEHRRSCIVTLSRISPHGIPAPCERRAIRLAASHADPAMPGGGGDGHGGGHVGSGTRSVSSVELNAARGSRGGHATAAPQDDGEARGRAERQLEEVAVRGRLREVLQAGHRRLRDALQYTSVGGSQFLFLPPGTPRASPGGRPSFFLKPPFGVSSFHSGLLSAHPASFSTASFPRPGQDGDVWTAEAGAFPQQCPHCAAPRVYSAACAWPGPRRKEARGHQRRIPPIFSRQPPQFPFPPPSEAAPGMPRPRQFSTVYQPRFIFTASFPQVSSDSLLYHPEASAELRVLFANRARG
eukprot:gene17048-biopygen4217